MPPVTSWVRSAQAGDENALRRIVESLDSVLRAEAWRLIYPHRHRFFLLDVDDLYQAGCIGIWHAIERYRHNHAHSEFGPWARLHIRWEMLRAIEHVTRGRDQHLEPTRTFDEPVSEDLTLGDVVADPRAIDQLVRVVVAEELAQQLATWRLKLSLREMQALILHGSGFTVAEIGRRLSTTRHAANALLSRARKKIGAPGRYQELPPNEEIVAMYRDEGLTCQEIAERLDSSYATINGRLEAAGCPRRPRETRRRKREHLVLAA